MLAGPPFPALPPNDCEQFIPVKKSCEAQARHRPRQPNFDVDIESLLKPLLPRLHREKRPRNSGAAQGLEAAAMNTLHAPPACRLALGMSRLTMRQAQQLRLATTAAVSTSSTLAPTTTEQPAPEENTRAERDAEEGRVHGHLPNHGQKIWIHNHTYDGHILYSFHRIVDV